jgi:hypothetical protein
VGVGRAPVRLVVKCVRTRVESGLSLPSTPWVRRRPWRRAASAAQPTGRGRAWAQRASPCRRARDQLAGGDVGLPHGLKPPGGVPCQPAAARVVLDAQPAGHLLAVVGLPTRQQVAPLPAQLLVAVMVTLPPVLESIRPGRNPRSGGTLRRSSRAGASPRSARIATIGISSNWNSYQTVGKSQAEDSSIHKCQQGDQSH